jgi:homoserine kinase type II
MARFTSLDGARLAAIAGRYGLAGVERAEPLAAGTINSNFRVESARGPIFLRVNEGKTEDEAAYEAALVAFLADGGVATPRPLATVDGAAYASVDGLLVTLFPWVGGEHREPPSPADCAALGRSLATMHRVGRSFPDLRPGRYAKPRIVERARALAGRAPDDVVADLHAALAAPYMPPIDGVIHGDLFPDNVLFESGEAVLLDFEQASGGSFVYDLAVCLLSWCWESEAGGRALVGAYGRVDAGELFEAARFAAARFTTTRLGDVELDPRVAPEIRAIKDYREFWAKLRALESLGPGGLSSRLSIS